MKQIFPGILALSLVAGCAELGLKPWPNSKAKGTPAPTEETAPEVGDNEVAAVPPAARTVEDFDTTTAAQRAEAQKKVPSAEINLGLTIASLGTATEPGFWLKTPLVSSPAKGRVVSPANGRSVQVDLIPIDGPKTGGSRMSLAALRLIDAPLTGLHEVRVFRVNN